MKGINEKIYQFMAIPLDFLSLPNPNIYWMDMASIQIKYYSHRLSSAEYEFTCQNDNEWVSKGKKVTVLESSHSS